MRRRRSWNAMPTRRNRNVSAKGETHVRENEHGVTGLPTHAASRASHFEFQQAFCSGRVGKGGSLRIRCPRLIFQMSKDRGHEAILLILDVAAIFEGSTAARSSWRESRFLFSRRFFFCQLASRFPPIFFPDFSALCPPPIPRIVALKSNQVATGSKKTRRSMIDPLDTIIPFSRLSKFLSLEERKWKPGWPKLCFVHVEIWLLRAKSKIEF